MAVIHDPTVPRSRAAEIAFGPFVLDCRGGRLLREGRPVEIAPKTLSLLEFLASHPGTLVTKEELLDAVWGHRFVSDSALKVAINGLRAALGEDARQPRWVHTVARRGYRFSGEVQVSRPEVALPLSARDIDADGEGDGASPHTPALPGNLPHAGTPLLGRDEDRARLHSALDHQRLVTLVGPGGVGKTRLALACAAHQAPPDGVWLLRLETIGEPDAIGPALARLLNLPEAAAQDPEGLGRAMSPLQLRLVLDNAEHLADPLGRQVGIWLQQAPGLRLLVTSQRPLHLHGELLLPLAPLALPDEGDGLEAIRRSPAVALLRQRVRALQPEGTLDASDWLGMAAIARALDGLPLALEFAAARVPLLGVRGVHQRLDERLRLLTRAAGDVSERHRTLRAALEWSVGLLPPEAAALLEVCSVFVGGFTLEAAQAVAAQVMPALDEWTLIDHLDLLRELALVVDGGTPDSPLAPARGSAQAEHIALEWFAAPRLRLYDSVRFYGLERLRARADLDRACIAHIDWLRDLLGRAEQVQLDLSEAVWLGRLEPELGNLEAAMSRALRMAQQAAPGDRGAALERLVDLCTASTPLGMRSGRRDQVLSGWRAVQALLGAGEADAGAVSPWLRARLDLTQAVLASHSLARLADGVAAVRRAVPVLCAHGDRRRALLATYVGTLMHVLDTGPDASDDWLAQLRGLIPPEATLYERRLLHWAEALIARRRGDLATFARFFSAMVDESELRGDRLEAWKAGWGAAQALFLDGRTDEAIALYDRTLDDLRAAGRARSIPLLVAQAALVRLRRDASPRSLALAREAARLLRPGGQIAFALGEGLPWAAWHQGRVDDALRLMAWCLETERQRTERRGPVAERVRAALVAALGDRALPAESGLADDAAVLLALGPSP
jgi:predicted ATPase/DNA-binding winged helix-turn-helix (wHTH) protein